MLLVFFLLLPLVIVPFLVERDSKWFKRFAFVIAGVQLIVMFFRSIPDEHASAVSMLPHLSDGVQLLIKTIIQIY
jgi:uncharacterized membrane protein YwaF